MSFLDNLENNLKALENLEAGGVDDRKRREAEREKSVAAAPWAEKLKKSEYAGKLMRAATKAGFARRMKVHFVWIDRSLRLEAMDERLELEPTGNGVDAVLGDRRIPVDLNGEPDALIEKWMEVLDRKREEQAAAVPEVPEED